MSLDQPKACAVDSFFQYGPTFLSGDWDGNGGGLNFGATLAAKSSGSNQTAYAYLAVANLANLHIEMVFDYQNGNNVNVSDYAALNGIGVAPRSYVTADAPSAQASGTSPRGAWNLKLANLEYTAFIGRNTNASYFIGTLAAGVLYVDNKITIDVSTDQGSNTYNVTVRLEMPDMLIDQTRVLTIDNGGGGTDGYIAIEGPFQLSATDIFSVTQLYITSPYSSTFNDPQTCFGDIPAASEVLRSSTAKLTHAGIYKAPGTAATAAQLHNEFKDAT